MKNYKTTILGILTIIGTLCKAGLDLMNNTPIDYGIISAGISTGVGLFLAKDAGVTGTDK